MGGKRKSLSRFSSGALHRKLRVLSSLNSSLINCYKELGNNGFGSSTIVDS